MTQLGYGFSNNTNSVCTDAEAKSTDCLGESACVESIYLIVEEDENSYSYTIVSLKRGTHVNGAGLSAGGLLTNLKHDIQMVLSRPEDVAARELEQPPQKMRSLDTDDLGHPYGVDISRPRNRDALIKGMAIGTAALALASTVAAIATSVASSKKIDDLDNTAPIDREAADIDAARGLTVASGVTLGTAILGGVSSAILIGVLVHLRKRESDKPKNGASLTVGLSERREGGMFVLRGEF